MSAFIRPPRRGRHVDLPTQQRRARHLHNISARSLVVRGTRGLLASLFTLHDPRRQACVLYRSEIIENSLNPSWKSFALDPKDGVEPSFSSVIVRVWVSDSYRPPRRVAGGPSSTGSPDLASFKIAIEWNVDLLALVYAGEHLFNERIPRDANTLVFGMFEGYYVAPVGDEKLSQRALAATLNTPHLLVDKEAVRRTYSQDALAKFNALHRRVANRKRDVYQVQQVISRRRAEREARLAFAQQCETNKCGISVMKEEFDRQQQCLLQERQVLEDCRAQLKERTAKLEANMQNLIRSQQDLRESRRHLKNRRRLAYRTGTCLQARRCIMLRDLSSIYPIVEQTKNTFSILGVRVPHSEALSSQSDEAIAVGFGYAAHLVYLTALFLHLPLRYAISPRGSRSVLKDDISDASVLLENKGACNLYPRQRADKDSYFQYALFLLNKNLSQLRLYCDLSTPDGRLTLKNIKTLLDRFSTLGERLHSHSVCPLPSNETDGDTVDGLPRPTRTFSVIPSFKGPTPRNAPSWIPVGTTPSPPPLGSVQVSIGHRRQHSAPLSPSTILISASDCHESPLSAGSSPTLTPDASHLFPAPQDMGPATPVNDASDHSGDDEN